MLNITETPRNTETPIANLLTLAGRKALLSDPSVIEIARAEWIATVVAGKTTLAFDAPAVQKALLENDKVVKAMNTLVADTASAFVFTDNAGVEHTGAKALELAGAEVRILFTAAKSLGQSHSDKEKQELIDAGVYASTGENGQILPVAKAEKLTTLLEALRAMGMNTVPNQSGLGKMKNIVI